MLSPKRPKHKSTPWREIIFSNKSYGTNDQNLPPLKKDYLDFYFSSFLEQLISVPTRVIKKTSTLIIHLLSNSSQKVSQCGVIELDISDHDLLYCTKKHLRLISIHTMKYLIDQWKITQNKNF